MICFSNLLKTPDFNTHSNLSQIRDIFESFPRLKSQLKNEYLLCVRYSFGCLGGLECCKKEFMSSRNG